MGNRKTVIITGASRGIGKATAELFSAKGWNVLINYSASDKEAFAILRNLQLKGSEVDLYKADVSNRRKVKQMVDYCLNKYGTIDVLINNAGVSKQSLFSEITVDEWNEILAVNLTGVFNCCQSVLPIMLKNKYGKIINVSSIWGMVGASCEVHYSAAKAGVIGLTKALAKELGPSNIQVNCVAPGIIETDMLSKLSFKELSDLKEATPLMKLGKPEDVANCILFLASEEANFITGQVVSPNGGFVI
ncbi:MAG: 3-oxoacyl-ACP reductase FabG [Desulfotomaculaceae bacterium]|nr:3-oxoacyl-ACP reductase FabG [Desulfotomaculaceae bacterium]